MKKTIITITGLFMVILLSSSAYAATATTTAGGADVTLTSTHGTAPDLTYTPSPSTLMSVVTSTTAYTIASASSKTDLTTGIEYCLISGDSIVYMKTQATAATVTSAGSTAGTIAADFAAKGGAGGT